jgi:predicted metal-binding transcription factor (methanogenesis marker protein 9)
MNVVYVDIRGKWRNKMCDKCNLSPEEYNEKVKKLKETLDRNEIKIENEIKVDHEAGERVDRLIGWRSLTVEDWFRPFNI